MGKYEHRQTSKIYGTTDSKILNVSRLFLQLSLHIPLKLCTMSSKKM